MASGVARMDRLLDGLYIGDNVVWHDDAGSLAWIFCLNFLKASQAEAKPIIYVSFDRSPKSLLEKLGPLAENPKLTILDCFTCGKGASSPVFMKFYSDKKAQLPCRVINVDQTQGRAPGLGHIIQPSRRTVRRRPAGVLKA